jgi:cardiolipin synthase
MFTKIMNLPNIITVFRIFLVPVIIILTLRENYAAALWFFTAAGVSDALDGYIARRFDMRTTLGATLDPLADKILIIASVIALCRLGLLPVWLMVVVVSRDLVIAGGAIAWHFVIGRLEMAPLIASKVNTFMQVVMILLVLGRASGMEIVSVLLPFIFAMVLLTSIISGFQYIFVWSRKALDKRRSHDVRESK